MSVSAPNQKIQNSSDLFNRALTSMNLLKNKVGKEQTKALGRVMASHPSLKSLCGLKAGTTTADFSNQGLGPGDALLIAEDLKVNRALTLLDISGNDLTNGGVDKHHIRITDMSSVKALAEALPKCP